MTEWFVKMMELAEVAKLTGLFNEKSLKLLMMSIRIHLVAIFSALKKNPLFPKINW